MIRNDSVSFTPTNLPFAVVLTVMVAAFTASPAWGQSVNAPDSVCTNDEFDVAWTGRSGTGDLITVANPAMPADQFTSSRSTNDGSPATLRAPGTPGIYEVRYVQRDPLRALANRNLSVTDCASSAQSGAAPSGTSASDSADVSAESARPTGPSRAVLVTGIQTDYGDMVNENPGGIFGTSANFTINDLCQNSGTIGWAMQTMVDQIELSMTQAGSPITLATIEGLPGAPARADIAAGLRVARDEFCDQPQETPSVYPYAITYAYCRMAMVTPQHAMDIHLPPGVGEGTMSMADHASREVMLVGLRRNLDAVANVIGPGWGDQINMRAVGDGGSRIGYETTQYNFDYTGGFGMPGAGALSEADVQGGAITSPQLFGNLISATTEGSLWASASAPGIDIVQSFYQNLTREVQLDQGSMGFIGGLVNNLVGMLRAGLPLEIEQTVSSRIMGRTAISGRSHALVTDVQLVDFDPAWCSGSLMPPEYTVTDIDQQLADAMAGSPGGTAGPSSGEMAQAMQQLNEAMQQMTPEQRQMMEQFGVGGMMPQAPASTPTSRSAGTAEPRRTRPSSEELYSDNLTQMIQNHLQALGYDTGNTSGEMSLETTIAISQFQAERGLEVTGEVSAQLAGILAAEVDR